MVKPQTVRHIVPKSPIAPSPRGSANSALPVELQVDSLHMLLQQRLSPENALRFVSLCCFVAAGLSVIFLASHVGARSRIFVGIQDLVSYFFEGLGIFVFFYVQYRLVPRFTKRTLNERLGYWQALGGLVLLLIGTLPDLILRKFWALPSFML